MCVSLCTFMYIECVCVCVNTNADYDKSHYLVSDNLFVVFHKSRETEVGSVLGVGHLLETSQSSAGLGVVQLLQATGQASHRRATAITHTPGQGGR